MLKIKPSFLVGLLCIISISLASCVFEIKKDQISDLILGEWVYVEQDGEPVEYELYEYYYKGGLYKVLSSMRGIYL